jgi:molecular chaperone IbpA
MVTTRTLPLVWDDPFFQQFIGMDRIINQVDRVQNNVVDKYPPRNVIKVDENNYLIEVATTGFGLEDLNVTKEKDQLIIEGKKTKTKEDAEVHYLQRTLGTRNFKLSFTLDSDMVVQDAKLKNGILGVYVERVVREEDKPQMIPIGIDKDRKKLGKGS